MISLDGFRNDYPEMIHLATFDSLAKIGVKARFLKPAFPSITFPNHYTMATGLYPDHHGIVANNFYDSTLDRHYSISDRSAVENPSFYGGEPVWVTAEKQGIRTASFFWVGSETPIKGKYPTYWKKYDQKIPFSARIDTVMSWLSLPENKRPQLVQLYYHEPDASGHQYGPESKEVKECLVELDRKLAEFIGKLKRLSFFSEINFIVVSDHGMKATSHNKSVHMSDYLQSSWFSQIKGSSPVWMFKVKAEYREKASHALKMIPHCRVWKSNEIPHELHYGKNPRTLDYVLLADNGWSVLLNSDDRVPLGAHGYDPGNKEMHAVFYAAGPSFKKGYTAKEFNTIDLYPLITRLMHIRPENVDGSIEQVIDMLKE
jgi:alkaline phosphatase D